MVVVLGDAPPAETVHAGGFDEFAGHGEEELPQPARTSSARPQGACQYPQQRQGEQQADDGDDDGGLPQGRGPPSGGRPGRGRHGAHGGYSSPRISRY